MIYNRVGPPVRGEDCFGRDSFVDLLWEKLEGGSILLAAPRRFGKTSIMYRLIDEPRNNYQVVHSDLEHLDEPSALITELIVKLSQDAVLGRLLTGIRGLPHSLISSLKKNMEEVELFDFKVKLRDEVRAGWQERGQELFQTLEKAGRPVLFILDELPMMIDRMARDDTRREDARTLLRWLRALRLAPEMKNTRFLIAGSIGIGYVLNDLGEIASINDFEQLRLEPFSRATADEFLDALSETHKLPLSDASRESMFSTVGTLVPYFIQILFSEVHKAYRQDTKSVSPESINRIYHERVLGVDCKTYFDYYYGRLREYYRPQEAKPVKRMLRELAAAGSLTRDTCYLLYRQEMDAAADLDAFNYMISNLENDFYIRFDSTTSQYEFACKLLRDWWLRHYGMGS